MSSHERERKEFEAFRRLAYQRKDEDGNVVTGLHVTSPNLTIERTRRCQNCLHFDQGDAFDRHVRHCIQRDAKVMTDAGKPQNDIDGALRRLKRTLASGEFGRCKVTERRLDGDEDFTHIYNRCTQWEGRIIVTAQEAAADIDAAEAYERAGLPVPENLKKSS